MHKKTKIELEENIMAIIDKINGEFLGGDNHNNLEEDKTKKGKL